MTPKLKMTLPRCHQHLLKSKRTPTLAKLLYILLLLMLAMLLLSAKAKRPSKKSKPQPTTAAQKMIEPALPPEPWPPQIPLQTNLRFTIRPTLLGLVPPVDDAGFGECFVRVLSTVPLIVHYEIKEQHEQLVGNRQLDVTAIRRGEVSIGQSAQLQPPLLWTTGSWNTSGGLLWLQPQAFETLKSSGISSIDLNLPTTSGDTVLASGLNNVVAQRRAVYGLTDGQPTNLVVQNWQTTYPAYVNGRRADLPAIRCTDSVRLAQYWILDDPANPLLLKMTYIAPALAESEPPVPAVKPATPGQSEQEQERVQAPPAQVQDPAEALIESGAGFAVINIDF